jgi:ribulose-phosphate 3-epimerase
MKAGVALNPHTPVEVLSEIICDIDLILIMSVNPGCGGQKFIPQAIEKVKKLKKLIQESGSKALIEIDGGVALNNYKKLVDCGADVLVAGNTVFSSANPKQTISDLLN